MKLALDTTTSHLMLALDNGKSDILRTVVSAGQNRYHSGVIIPEIKSLIRASGLHIRALTDLCVNVGPGSFTGIRTGLVTARTIAQFIPAKVYAFNTFVLASYPHRHQDRPVAVYLDAGRGRSYYALLCWQSKGFCYSVTPRMVDLSQGVSIDTEVTSLFSASLVRFLSDAHDAHNIHIIEDGFFTPECMLVLLAEYSDRFFVNWTDLQPLYIQKPSITKKQMRT